MRRRKLRRRELLGRVRRIDTKPGDTVVVELDYHPTRETVARIIAEGAEAFGSAVKILVCAKGTRVAGIVRPPWNEVEVELRAQWSASRN